MTLGRDEALRTVQQAIDMALSSGASKAFALLKTMDEGLTRYSNSTIENSTRQYIPSLYLKVEKDGRLAAGSVEQLGNDSVHWLAQSLVESATQGSRGARPLSLAAAACSYPVVDSYDPATARMSAEERADLIHRACACVRSRTDVRLYGNAVSGHEERAIANSRGTATYFCGSLARFQVTALADSRGAGMLRHIGRSMKPADPEDLADRALFKASHYRDFSDVPPGDYEVILEPSATAEVLFHLSYLGLGGLGHLRGNSCFAGQIGEQVLSPLVTIEDDPLRVDNLSEPFDWDGTPHRSMTLIKDGTLIGPVYDLESAAEAGLTSTGHGLPPERAWFSEGPFPGHLVLRPGVSTPADLISHVKHGLLVTAFHYTRPLDQRRAIITGMTRNGTFLIESGRITGMLPNLRFAVSAISLLKNVLEIGNDLRLAGDYNVHLAPSIRTTGFSVTGKTAS